MFFKFIFDLLMSVSTQHKIRMACLKDAIKKALLTLGPEGLLAPRAESGGSIWIGSMLI